eukprot:m.208915 g.208915  ORF g.208915 m.208915 type:complete len:71 (-) comp33023_c0_seq1:126-338(-)
MGAYFTHNVFNVTFLINLKEIRIDSIFKHTGNLQNSRHLYSTAVESAPGTSATQHSHNYLPCATFFAARD